MWHAALDYYFVGIHLAEICTLTSASELAKYQLNLIPTLILILILTVNFFRTYNFG